MTLMVIY